MKTLISLVLFSAMAFGQAKPAQQTLSADQQVKILKAQHTIDDLQKKAADIQLSWDGIQRQQADLKSQFEQLSPQLEAAKKTLKTVTDDAAKAAGLDPEKYDLNSDLVFVPKATPAPATPLPGKK